MIPPVTEKRSFLLAHPAHRKNIWRLGFALAGLAALGVIFLLSLANASNWSGVVVATLNKLRAFGAIGWLAFVWLEILVAVVGFLPASVLCLIAGAVYGIGFGFVLAAAGVIIGAEISFVLVRSGFRSALTSLFENRSALRQFDTAFGQQGWRFVLLLRASPIMPFSLTSFALGLSGVSQSAYTLGTIGSLPALLLYVILGRLSAKGVASAHYGADLSHLLLLSIGIIATLLLAIKVGRLATGSVR